MIKLSPNAQNILQIYREEAMNRFFGAQVRCAERLGITKQAVHQVVHGSGCRRVQDLKRDPIYFTCYICGLDVPISFKAHPKYRRNNCCKDCAEQYLRKCMICKAVFRYVGQTHDKKHFCSGKCVYIRMKKWIDKITEENGEALARHRSSVKQYNKKYNREQKESHGPLPAPRRKREPSREKVLNN